MCIRDSFCKPRANDRGRGGTSCPTGETESSRDQGSHCAPDGADRARRIIWQRDLGGGEPDPRRPGDPTDPPTTL
eukprot:1765160-Pyramimonas_sp.AAC.1